MLNYKSVISVLHRQIYKNTKLIVNYHHLENDWLYNLIDERVVYLWDVITVDSLFTKNQLVERYPKIAEDRIRVIYAGVDKKFKRLVHSDNLPRIPDEWKKKKKLLFLNGLKERKNPQFLVHLMAKLPGDYVLIMAGKGGLLNELQRLAKALKVDGKILFWGYVEEKDKVALLNWADLLLSPSLMEGFGMVPVEAQACGTPVIVSNRGSLPEVVDNGSTGFVLPLEDSLWHDAVIQLIEDQKLRSRMVKNSILFSKKFSWDKSARGLMEIMYELLHESKS